MRTMLLRAARKLTVGGLACSDCSWEVDIVANGVGLGVILANIACLSRA